MPAPYTGRCVCDAVRYRLKGEPITLYACHCTDCQKRSGAAFGLSLWVKRADIEVTQGEAATLVLPGKDGMPRHTRTCARCATRLWGERPDREIAIVRPGTLDETKWLHPIAHIWTRSAQPWVAIPKDVPHFGQQPPDMQELIALWSKAHSPK